MSKTGSKAGSDSSSKKEPNKELRSRAMAYSPHMAYVPEGDRYILSKGIAKYKFNVIGLGVNGQA